MGLFKIRCRGCGDPFLWHSNDASALCLTCKQGAPIPVAATTAMPNPAAPVDLAEVERWIEVQPGAYVPAAVLATLVKCAQWAIRQSHHWRCTTNPEGWCSCGKDAALANVIDTAGPGGSGEEK